MKFTLSILSKALLLILLVSGGLAVHSKLEKAQAQSSAGNVSGWAWSDNIGWISFNCSDIPNLCSTTSYGVSVDENTGSMSGYAWSDTLGWLSFNQADTGGCPDGSNCAATINLSTGKISGYGRFCAGTVNGNCTGSSRTDGWSGWLKLSDTNISGFSSPVLNGSQAATFDPSTLKIVGYGWGSDVVGWLKFDNLYQGVVVDIDASNLTCSISGTLYPLSTTITRFKEGSVIPPEICESITATCVQTSPTTADWNTDITPISNGTYSYSTCTVSSDDICTEGNDPCDISALTAGTNIGQTLSCGEEMKFYKEKIVVNNAAGTITCDSNGNSAIRVCQDGTLSGDPSFNKPICRVNPYQKER